MNVELAELLGMMCGDGCLSKTAKGKHFVYCSGNRLKDKDYFGKYVPGLFHEVFGKIVVAHEREKPKVIYIKFSDKAIFSFLHELELPIGSKYELLKIPQKVLEKQEYKRAFIRGLFDTDGCVVFSKQHRKIPYYPRIEITSKSQLFLRSVFDILLQDGFFGSLSNKGKIYSRLEIPGFKNIVLWRSLINSSNERNISKLEQANKSYLNHLKTTNNMPP